VGARVAAGDATTIVMKIVGFANKPPYSEEMWLVYNAIFYAYFRERQLEECLDWLHLMLRVAAEHNDLSVYGETCFNLARVQACQGNLVASLATREEGSQLLRQIGEVKRHDWCQLSMAWVYLFLGKLDLAEQYAVETIENTFAVNEEYLCDLHLCLGMVALAKGEWAKAG
jgi:pentatricopeptide repeat protein